MATIITKNSSTAGAVPIAGDLVQGEIAVNVTDKKLYTKNASGSVVQITPVVNDNGFKNRIINGAMMIDQRNAGASVTPTNGTYTVDRWHAGVDQSGKFSVQQSSTAAVGFVNSMLCTSLSAYTVGANEAFQMRQNIEGLNVSDLAWGTANAAAVTLSFWVRSSLTGTFGGSLVNNAYDRSYPFSYTISAANTWEQKSVTIAGDTSGTWLTTNGVGIRVGFGLGAGSSKSTTAGAWASGFYGQPTSTVSVVGTSGATFYITGVQLEKGSTATSFDYRPYGTELALCQRYYEKSYDVATAPASSTTNGAQVGGGPQGATTTSEVNPGTTRYKVSKRAVPSVTIYDTVGNSGKCTRVQAGVSISTNQPIALDSVGTESFFSYSSSGATATGASIHYTASAEL